MRSSDYERIKRLRTQVDELLMLATSANEDGTTGDATLGTLRPAWVMCFGTDEVDDVRGITRRWVQLYTHEGLKVVDYALTDPLQTDVEMWDKAAQLLGYTLVPGIPEVSSRGEVGPA